MGAREGSDRAKEIWVFSDCDIILGSVAHRLVEAITGKTFTKDSEPPRDVDLVGGRVQAYVTYETPKTGKSAGIKREAIVDSSIEPFRVPAPTSATNGKAPTSVSADPSDDEVDRALIVTKLQKQVARLLKLDPKKGEQAQEAVDQSDLDAGALSELETLLTQVTDAVARALDD